SGSSRRPSRRATRSCSSPPTPRLSPPCCWPRSRPSSCRQACSTWSAVTGTPAASSSRTPRRAWCPSRVRCGLAWRSPVRPPTTSSGCTSNWAARRPSWSSTTPTSRPPRRASPAPGTSTPGRTVPRRPGCGPRVAADLTAALGEQARNTKTGGLDVEDAYFGPLNNPNQLARVEGFLERVPDHAPVVAGGHRVRRRGYLFEPTVVSELQQHDEMIQDEIFGPVITVQRFTDEDEAVRWANGVQY